MTAQKLASLEDSEKKLNAELKANCEKAGVANLLLQDCNKKLSEAVGIGLIETKPKLFR